MAWTDKPFKKSRITIKVNKRKLCQDASDKLLRQQANNDHLTRQQSAQRIY